MSSPIIVVIATCQRSPLLERTLRSLGQCAQPPEYARTIVVENGGRHGAEAIVRNAPPKLRAEYLYEPAGNKSRALNRVLEQMESALLVFTDDDVRFDCGFLTAYSAAACQYQQGVFFGGPMSVDYEEEPLECLKPYFPWSAVGWEWSHGEHVSQPVFLGCNWAAFATDLRDAGGFDCHVGPGASSGSVGQDSGMQAALLKNGFRGCYIPGARVWHYVPRERCTLKWTLHRQYRTHIRVGLVTDDPSPRVFGVPRWMFKEVVLRYLRARLTGSPKPNASSLEKWSAYWGLRGEIYGCWLATNLANRERRETARPTQRADAAKP